MNWSDERYVKLYTRDTLTWLSLGFEARAVLALMLRKVNGAGVIETGTMEAARALALQIVAPVDVVRVGLAELIAHEVVEAVPNGVAMTNFIEAQEATKTETRKKRDQRQRDLDKRRQAQVSETVEASVPACPVVSRAVPLQPSPAQLTTSSPPAQPSPPPAQKGAGRSRKPKAQAELPEIVPPPPPKPPTIVERLYAYFAEGRELKGGLPGMPEELPLDEPPNWPRTGATIATWMAMRTTPEAGETWAKLIIDQYLEDPFWAGATDRQTGASQPYPWNALLSEKVWRRLIEQLDREAESASPEAGAA